MKFDRQLDSNAVESSEKLQSDVKTLNINLTPSRAYGNTSNQIPPPPPAPNTTHTRTHPAHTFEIECMRHNSISEGNFFQILLNEKLKINDHSIFLSLLARGGYFF